MSVSTVVRTSRILLFVAGVSLSVAFSAPATSARPLARPCGDCWISPRHATPSPVSAALAGPRSARLAGVGLGLPA